MWSASSIDTQEVVKCLDISHHELVAKLTTNWLDKSCRGGNEHNVIYI